MKSYVLTVAAVAVLGAGLAAQKTTPIHPGKGGSPHVRTDWSVDGAAISVEYGRPYLKGRRLETPAPHGQIWRAGADEATTLRTDKPLKFGSLAVPAGTYTLWVVPADTEWQLVISKATGQWGTQYKEGEDLGRVPMKVTPTKATVEQLTWSIDDTPGGATLRLEWGPASAAAPFSVGS